MHTIFRPSFKKRKPKIKNPKLAQDFRRGLEIRPIVLHYTGLPRASSTVTPWRVLDCWTERFYFVTINK